MRLKALLKSSRKSTMIRDFIYSTCSLVNEMDFSVVIFDTAPTGHTLRFLSMPNLFVKGMEKLGKLKGQFGSIVSQVYIVYKPQCKLCDFYFNIPCIMFKPQCLLIYSNRAYTIYCGFVLIIVVTDGRRHTGRGPIIISRKTTTLSPHRQTD